MATKKSSKTPARATTKAVKSAKTAKPATKSSTKAVKSSTKSRAVAKSQKFCPYHPAFGVVLLLIAAIIFSFLLGGLILEF